MAINYAWDVSTVDTYPTKDSNADVVYNVHWGLTGTDDTNKDSDDNYWTAGVKAISNDGAVTNDRTSGTHMRWHCIPSLDSFVSRNANFTFP